MNIRLTTRNCALSLIPGLLAALLIQACGGGDDAVAQSAAPDADPIEGAWQSAVTVRDCTSGAVLRTFTGFTVLHRGGTASATNNLPPSGNGPAFGSWKRGSAGSTYTATLRFFRFNPDGSFAGAQNLTRSLTLAADGKSLSGTLSVQVVDPAEVVLATSCGTETALRVAVS